MIHGMINYNLAAAPGVIGPDGEGDGTREALSLDWQMSETASRNSELIAALGMRFMRSIIRTMPEDRRERVWQEAMLRMEALLADYRGAALPVTHKAAVSSS